MLPDEHAVISGLVVFIAAQVFGLSTPDVLVWTFLGMVAGVLIDVDHALLAMTVKGRISEGLYWFRHPFRAVRNPDAFLAEMDYPMLVYHRLMTHSLIFLALVLLRHVHELILPVLIGVIAHIIADIVWDVKRGALP